MSVSTSAVLTAALMLVLPCALAAAPLAGGSAAAGRDKADSERCLECHSSIGPGQGYSEGTEGKFAKLAGQYPEYIVKQIEDFRSGRRKHEFMAMMAKSISNADLADIAAYFGAERKMASGAAARDGAAQRLYQQGDPARKVLACASCHGADGGGHAAGAIPAIGGQGLRYLEQQLLAWRSGERHNSSAGVMNQQVAPLSDAEIQALAHYLSEL